MAYSANRDDDRTAAIRIRNVLVTDTRSSKNEIEEERLLKPAKVSDFLPAALNDEAA